MADISKFDDISKLQTYEDYIANNIAEWESDSISRVCGKIGKIGKMSKKELEKFDADKEAKKEWERIVSALAIATALNIRTLKKAYISEFETWEKQNEYLYQYRGKKPLGVKNGALQGIIDRYVKQNAKEILNLTNTKALSVLDRNGNPIRFQDAIYKSFGDAVKTVTDGKADFYTTMRQTVQNLGGGGCRVNYGEGITRRLDTVVRQNMAYGIKQSYKEYNALVGREIGADGIEIDYHSNSRPSHRYMQGKQYAKGAEGKTVNGVFYPSAEKEGVYDRLYEDYNCRHYETDIILGVSEPRYSTEELRRFEEQDKRLYKIGNIEKDGYGWSQSLRSCESEIRKCKDEINALKAFGNSEQKIKELRKRIKTVRAKYNEIAEVTGISAEPKRLSVPRENK
ncbi:MAG: phage minor capsid protein [Acutalibacteraceae bacterium]|nr:phage minor capsid protein [Acutalibacteraceae bacterium]